MVTPDKEVHPGLGVNVELVNRPAAPIITGGVVDGDLLQVVLQSDSLVVNTIQLLLVDDVVEEGLGSGEGFVVSVAHEQTLPHSLKVGKLKNRVPYSEF
jgi:hypothetical protein